MNSEKLVMQLWIDTIRTAALRLVTEVDKIDDKLRTTNKIEKLAKIEDEVEDQLQAFSKRIGLDF